MKKFILFSLIVSFLVFGLSVSAQESGEGEVVINGGVTVEDLGVGKPKILPTNPFYLFKEWGRGIRSFFTFGAIAKTRLELRFVNIRAAEIKVLEEKRGDNLRGIKKAINNYNKNIERLKKRITSLKETSENPNVDNFLNLLADRTIKHQELFEELSLKKEALRDTIEIVRDGLDDVSVEVIKKLDSPEKFKIRLEKAINNQREDVLKEFNAINALDRLEKKLPTDAQAKISELKGDLILKFEGRFKADTDDNLSQVLDSLFIASPEKLRVFDEIREGITDSTLKSRLNLVRQNALKISEEEEIIEEPEANLIMSLAKEVIDELVEKIDSGKYLVSDKIKQLLERAEFNLDRAQEFYSEGQYGDAFSQATAAQAAAKNGLNQLLQSSREELAEDNLSLRIEFDNLAASAKKKSLTRDNSPKLYDIFDRTEKAVIEAGTVDTLRDVKIMLAEIEVLIKNGAE
ncbi:MAG: DUF5667 domain-containing protein [Patescibacteria group bacterium]|nr:DUF5667 domain-containing protein [Patescibacteria group bacterium]